MKSKTSVSLLLILIFSLGGITGAVLHYLYQNHAAAASPRAGAQARDIVEDLAQGLRLDAQQKQTLKVILNQSRERYRVLSRQLWPQYESIRNETDQQIRQILHDGQKTRFEQFLRDLHSRPKQKESRNN